jgi:predicted metal-binding membrane protein
LLWIGFGIVLYILIGSLVLMGDIIQFQNPYFRFLPALIVLGTGIYQFAPFKGTCLSRCHPTTFLVRNYRGGITGSAMMGVSYGFFCIGCCWALMIILLLIGSMNLAWMGIFAFAILIERITPASWQVSKIIGVLILILGALVTYQTV